MTTGAGAFISGRRARLCARPPRHLCLLTCPEKIYSSPVTGNLVLLPVNPRLGTPLLQVLSSPREQLCLSSTPFSQQCISIPAKNIFPNPVVRFRSGLRSIHLFPLLYQCATGSAGPMDPFDTPVLPLTLHNSWTDSSIPGGCGTLMDPLLYLPRGISTSLSPLTRGSDFKSTGKPSKILSAKCLQPSRSLSQVFPFYWN